MIYFKKGKSRRGRLGYYFSKELFLNETTRKNWNFDKFYKHFIIEGKQLGFE